MTPAGSGAAALDRAVDDGLLAREPLLPGLATLLDDDRLAALLQERGWLPPRAAARADRVRLKTGVRAQAAVRTHPGGPWFLVNAYSAGGWGKARKDERVAHQHGHPTLVDEERLLVVAPVVADRDLPALWRLSPLDGSPASTTTLAYNPARRWVGAVHDGGGHDGAGPEGAGPEGAGPEGAGPVAVVKVHADPRAGARAAAAGALVAARGVATPPAAILAPGVVRTPWVDGPEADPRSAADAALVADVVGRLSAAGHDRPSGGGPSPADLPRLRGADLLDRARAATAALGGIDPAAGARAAGVLLALDPVLRHQEDDLALVHGDLSADQVLVTADGPVLLDLDRASTGPRGWDAASWVAAQAALGVPAEERAPLPGTPVPASLLAAAALARAPEPWRRRRSGRAVATAMLLDLAEDAVAAATRSGRGWR